MEANVSELPPLHYTVHTSAKERAVKEVTAAAEILIDVPKFPKSTNLYPWLNEGNV